MNILLVSATSAEIVPLTAYIGAHWRREPDGGYANGRHRLNILVTGVGMVATAYALTKALQREKADLVLQAGIAGSFDRSIPLGTVVFVDSDRFGDLGAEDHYNFLDVFELNLADANEPPFKDGRLDTPQHLFRDGVTLPRVSALSVNRVSGSAFTATARLEQYGSQTESMEGAALHYVCLKENVPFMQIRAISNYVEARDKSKWQIGEAVAGLNEWLIRYLETV